MFVGLCAGGGDKYFFRLWESGNQQLTTSINHHHRHHLNIHHREPFYQPPSSSDLDHPLPEAYSNITSSAIRLSVISKYVSPMVFQLLVQVYVAF